MEKCRLRKGCGFGAVRVWGVAGLEYPSWSRSFCGPKSVYFDEFIGQNDELSHQHPERNFGGLSSGAEGLVFGFEVWIEAHCDEGWHVEGLAQVVPSALNERLSCPLTRLAGHRGEACAAGRLFAVLAADFGHFDQDCSSADGTDAGIELMI